MTLESNERKVVGWPAEVAPSHLGISFQGGKQYEIALRASARGPLSVVILGRVGHRGPPYTPLIEGRVPVSEVEQNYYLSFVAPHSDEWAGLSFIASVGEGAGQNEVCVAEVGVQQL